MSATTIDLSRPIKSVREQDGINWRTVFVYECPAGHSVRVFANSFRGNTPVPGIGGIVCAQCEFESNHEKSNQPIE